MSGLKELQKEWRDFAGALPESAGDYAAMKFELADSLQPHIEHMEALEAEVARYKLALEKADYEFAYGLYETAKLTVRAALHSEARSILGAKEEGNE